MVASLLERLKKKAVTEVPTTLSSRWDLRSGASGCSACQCGRCFSVLDVDQKRQMTHDTVILHRNWILSKNDACVCYLSESSHKNPMLEGKIRTRWCRGSSSMAFQFIQLIRNGIVISITRCLPSMLNHAFTAKAVCNHRAYEQQISKLNVCPILRRFLDFFSLFCLINFKDNKLFSRYCPCLGSRQRI